MNLNSLVPAGQCAQSFGVKSVLYGGPGTGKTPLINTAPSPVLLAIEPGLRSMAGSQVLTYKAYEHKNGVAAGVQEFFEWFKGSNEVNRFDTFAMDSVSEMAEAILRVKMKANTNKMKAYGEMSFDVMDILTWLYYLRNKHVILIAKQHEDPETKRKRPSFPGQDLHTKVPHFFDGVWHYAKLAAGTIPGVLQEVKAIRTIETFDIMARDRSGNLNEFEQPNLGNIINKCMSK